MNQLHVNKTRFKNKTKMKDFFTIQIIDAKYVSLNSSSFQLSC